MFKIIILINIFFSLGFVLLPRIVWAVSSNDDISEIINNLKIDINQKQSLAKDLEKQIGIYEAKILKDQAKQVNLKTQIKIFENRITKEKLNIYRTETEISKTLLDINRLELEIGVATQVLTDNKAKIGQLLRSIYRLKNINELELLLTANSLTDAFDRIKYLSVINSELTELVKQTEITKNLLKTSKSKVESNRDNLKKLKTQIIVKTHSLEQNKKAKADLFVLTRESEKKFQNLIQQVRQEYEEVDQEIKKLEKQLRKKLEEEKIFLGKTELVWPVRGDNKIITRFNDPDYPYRYVYEHPGIDVRSPQGSNLYSASNGYVIKTHNGGRRGFSYIVIMHGNGLSTMYGHIYKILVKEGQLVKSGQKIGLTGGMPRTNGAGRLTTGPHLHFEVRLNSIPVNPLAYLP